MSVLLIRTAKRKYSFDVFEKQGRMKPYQRIAVIALLVLMLVWSYLDWKGFKVLKEFQYNGWLKFMFQYIYYLFETVLVVLIIVFGQKAKIPKAELSAFGISLCSLFMPRLPAQSGSALLLCADAGCR